MAEESLADIYTMDKVLSLKVLENALKAAEKLEKEAVSVAEDHSTDSEAGEIEALLAERSAAKKAKDFARADQIRSELAARGITIIDTPQGPTWKRS